MKAKKLEDFHPINEDIFKVLPQNIQDELTKMMSPAYRKVSSEDDFVSFLPTGRHDKSLVEPVNDFMEELGFESDLEFRFRDETKYSWVPGKSLLRRNPELENIRIEFRSKDEKYIDFIIIVKSEN